MSHWHKPAPALLEQLVSEQPQLGPNPPTIVDWVEKDDKFVVILEDGRKLTFSRASVERRRAKQRQSATSATRVAEGKKLDPVRAVDSDERKRDFTEKDFREHVGQDRAPKKK